MDPKSNKTPNYTAAQEDVIRSVAATAGGTLNLALATSIASDPAMNTADGSARNVKSVIAKINRMGIPYERKQSTTKDGRPVVKKSDLVGRIAAAAGVQASKLDGADKSPKLALETILSAFVALRDEVEALTGTDDE